MKVPMLDLKPQYTDVREQILAAVGHVIDNTAFCNGPTCAERQGDWIVDYLVYLREHGVERFEATPQAEDQWRDTLAEMATTTLLSKADSWYMGANIPGKPRQLLSYFGVSDYMESCNESARNGYSGFVLN